MPVSIGGKRKKKKHDDTTKTTTASSKRSKVGLYTLLISVILCLVQQFILIRDHIVNNQNNNCNKLPSEIDTTLPLRDSIILDGDDEHAGRREEGSPFKTTEGGGGGGNNNNLTMPSVKTYIEEENGINLATKFLTGKVRLEENFEFKFIPGSLQLEMKEALMHCYVNPSIYKNHMGGGWETKLVSVSEKHKLIYIMIGKSGSSTSRFMMERRFDAAKVVYKSQTDLLKASSEQNYTVFTFLREPLSRFWSSYEEAFFRTSPFNKFDNAYFNKPHPYPFLHEGMKEFVDYQDIWCPPETVTNKRNPGRECADRQTMENGTLAARLERFVKEMDIETVIDVHLKLQVPMLANSKTGYVIDLDRVYSVADATETWENIAISHGLNLSDPIPVTSDITKRDTTGVIRGRSYPRRFDKSRISNETKQRICEHVLIDYCCMNMPLPPPCDNLYCRLNHGEEKDKDGKKRLQIQAWSIPTK